MAGFSSIFGTRVALRVFASFALVAIAPLLIAGVLVLTHVSWTLEDQAQRRLNQTSALIGQQLLDRLLIIDDTLGHLARSGDDDQSLTLESAQLETDGHLETLFGEPFEMPSIEAGDRGLATLIVRPGSGAPEVLIGRHTIDGLVVGKVRSEYLWDAGTLLPYATELCVVDNASTAVLHCTDETQADWARHSFGFVSATGTRGRTELSESEGDRLISHWELFLPSRFESTPWAVFITEPRAYAIEPLGAFRPLIPTAFGSSILLSLLLASIQIRRIMQPLRTLVSGTRRIAEGDFSAPVVLEGGNEFRELADAMNEMATSLDRQFDTISALAEIDRLILSSQSIGEVLERVLDRIVAISSSYCASVLLIDPDKPERAQLFSRLPRARLETQHARIELDRRSRAWLARVAAGSRTDAASIREIIPELPSVPGLEEASVVPLFRADELRGAMITQMPDSPEITEADRGRLFELAGRLAVAVSAADHESELFHRAHFDALTELPNRQLCFDRLDQAIAHARREGRKLAVLFIDLDRFKNVNDSLGHALGDELLKETAFRLSGSVRETDTVSRLGGDEYVVILPNVDGLLEVDAIVDKIVAALGRPFVFGGQEFSVSASIGVTLFPDDATDAESLLQKADTAMYAAKDSGRARVEYFEEEMDRIIKERLQMQRELREAFRKGQFHLVFQAQLDIETGRLFCMEALIRWHHPERGSIPPSTFIPILEDMGMIGPVGRWVIATALRSYSEWKREGLMLPRMSINVSGKQLGEEDLEQYIVNELSINGLDGSNLEIELTEHCLIDDIEQSNIILSRLGKHGIRVAIDDFGTGYSSLGYLQGLRFDALKIDRAFVQGLPGSKSVAIVEAVIAVANALGKDVIAEGVSSEAQRAKLLELGCRIGQGYLLSLPIPGDEVVEWSARLDETSVIQKLVALNG